MKAVLPALVDLVPERMKPGADLIAEGKALSRDWRVGGNVFLETNNVTSEAEYKRRKAAEGKIMQHAHIGFRSVERTVDAIGEVHGTCASRGVTVDRFGITLDWSMGYPVALRKDRPKGTGIVLNGAEDFARITNAAPAAAHFGDFMLDCRAPLKIQRVRWQQVPQPLAIWGSILRFVCLIGMTMFRRQKPR